jgi:hypothetical protein
MPPPRGSRPPLFPPPRPGAAAPRPAVCKIGTRCANRQDFVLAFAPFVDAFTLFIPVPAELPLTSGRVVTVEITLREGQLVFRARAQVLDVYADDKNRFGRPGVRFRLREMVGESQAVHQLLLRQRAAQPPPPVLAPLVPTSAKKPEFNQTLHGMALPPNPFAEISTSAIDLLIEATLSEESELCIEEGTAESPPPEHFEALPDEAIEDAPPETPLPTRLVETTPPPVPVPALVRPAAASASIVSPPGWRRAGGPLVVASLLGVLALVVWRANHRASIAPPPSAALLAAPAPVAEPAAASSLPQVPVAEVPVARAVAAAPAVESPPASPEPEPAGERPRAATGGKCTARVDSVPRGAVVSLGRRRMGRTPIEALALPCGDSTLTFEHKRYERTRVPVTATSATLAEVAARLGRPPATLQVASVPPGASVRVNGRAVGRTPLTLPVSRYETVRIEALAPGHKPWRQSVYLRTPVTRLSPRLTTRR